MAFEDAFADVQFTDAKVDLGGAQDAGNPGTPAPDKELGQQADTPPATADPDAGKSPDDKGAQPPDKPAGEKDKPPPYDQDPKWKKARAVEASVEKLLKEHGILDVEELGERLAKGLSLERLLGSRDPSKLLEDAEYANRVRQNWDTQKRDQELANETPEARIERLEMENAKLRDTHESFKSEITEREKAKQVLANFNAEVDKVIRAEETPIAEHELPLLKLVLGIDAPSNDIDIEDQMAVRKMAREGIATFRNLVQTIQQKAIESYVAGKQGLAVDTQKGTPASPQGAVRQPIPKDASNDQVFGSAKDEFLEVLTKGVASLV